MIIINYLFVANGDDVFGAGSGYFFGGSHGELCNMAIVVYVNGHQPSSRRLFFLRLDIFWRWGDPLAEKRQKNGWQTNLERAKILAGKILGRNMQAPGSGLHGRSSVDSTLIIGIENELQMCGELGY